MSDKLLLVETLTPQDRKNYQRGVFWRIVEGVFAGLAAGIAFVGLWWGTAGNDVNVAIITTFAASLLVLIIRYFAGGASLRRSYSTTFEGGVLIRSKIIRHLTRLPLSAFRKLHAGKVAQALSEDMMWLENNTSFFAPGFLAERAMLCVLLTMVAIFHWPSALATILVWAAGLFVIGRIGKRLEVGLRFRSDGIAEASRHIMEFAEGMQVIRTFGKTGAAERDYHKWLNIMREGFRKSVKRNAPIASLASGLATSAVGIGALVAIITRPQDGELATIVATIGLLTATLIPSRAMITYNNVAKIAQIGEENIRDIEAMPVISEGNHVAKPGPAEIVFDNVSFSYDDKKAALSDVGFKAGAGTITAIVGRSGSGKTSLANLMLRFWDKNHGEIYFNGRPIGDYTIESYMDRFAAVFQETMLFRDSVANNIKIGKPDASMDEIIMAAKAAQIHDTIMALPSGYDEIVGPSGSTLSGGERQRMTIARAILKDADIVILDEATSALDPENEREIQLAFEALARDKTVFIIAHRLSTIIHADNILLLDQGRLVAQGDHESLMEKSDLYRLLWDSYKSVSEWKL